MKSRVAKGVLSVLGVILCIVFAVMLVFNVTIIIKGATDPNTPPTIFGVAPMVVQSGSMSGNAEDHIEVGDMIFVAKTETDQLKVGDVISYMSDGSVITHRIIKIENDQNGKLQFITKGDANNIQDELPVPAESVIGKYKARIAGIGDFAMFLQKPLGMIIFIGVPVCAFIVYDIIRRRRKAKSESEKTKELEEEIERLRSAEKPE